MDEKSVRRHSIFWPVFLIAPGVFLFMSNANLTSSGGWDLLRLWPLLLIVGGLDSIWRGYGYVGAVVGMGLGVIFLLGNLGYLPGVNEWDVLWRFWPVFLIALGCDIIIGRRKLWSPVIGLGVGVVVTAGLAWLILTSPAALAAGGRIETVSFPAAGFTTANGNIALPVGKLLIAADAESANLVSGKVTLSGSEQLNSNFNNPPGTYYINVQGNWVAVRGPGESNNTVWDLKMNATVPLDLTVKTGVGEQMINLTGMNLTRFSCEIAVGTTQVTLPAGSSLSGSIKGAVGELVVWVPRGAGLRLRLSTGLTSVSLPPDYTRSDHDAQSPNISAADGVMNLTIDQALGSVSVRYLP